MKQLTAEEDAKLRETLKRCPAQTYTAAKDFLTTARVEHLPVFVEGIISRYVERELRAKLNSGPADDLRLVEDLGFDSLTLMEMVMLAEEVLQISIHNEELRDLRTIGDVKRRLAEWVSRESANPCAPDAATCRTRDIAAPTPRGSIPLSNPS